MSKKLSKILIAAGISIVVSESNCLADAINIEKEANYNSQGSRSLSQFVPQDMSSKNLLAEKEISSDNKKLVPNLFLQDMSSENLMLEDGPQDFICTTSNGGCTNNGGCTGE